MENSDGHIYPDTINAMDYCFDHYDQLMAQMADTAANTETETSAFAHSGETEDLPAFAPLTETETETEAAVPDARTSLSPKVLASHLKSKLMTFSMHHMALFILCMLVAFALFTLILIWLYHVLKRSYHRHKYKRLRNERIKKNIKNK